MKMTLALSVRNDFQGLFFTINSAWLATKGTLLEGQLAIVVVNDSDDVGASYAVEGICQNLGVRCQTVDYRSNHAGRNAAVKMSRTYYTVLADSHVLFQHGFFDTYLKYLQDPAVGLIHSPFTCGGVPTYRSNCFYNMAKFDRNLHGSFSHRGALDKGLYPVALAPHAAYGFRTLEWLAEVGGYINECKGNGGGEPFVSFKYHMFGKGVYLTPDTGYVHMDTPKYSKVRGQWRRNHAITAAALGGHAIGQQYATKLGCMQDWDVIWAIAEPHHTFVKVNTKVEFTGLMDHWHNIKARPFIYE